MPSKHKKRKSSIPQPDFAAESFYIGWRAVQGHPIFGPISRHIQVYRNKGNPCPQKGWAVVTNNGVIHAHPTREAQPDEWTYILAHCLLHLGLDHFKHSEHPIHWNLACDWVVTTFLQEFKLGKAPAETSHRLEVPIHNETKFYDQLLEIELTEAEWLYSTAGSHQPDMLFEPPRSYTYSTPPDWKALFAEGILQAVGNAVAVANGAMDKVTGYPMWEDKSRSGQARKWFINHFPLLGALAANFKIIEDSQLCYRMGISVAAVDAEASTIYISPAAGLNLEQYKFVIAHELLHVALRHHARRQGRDAYLWNIACDYVINDWLLEMEVGEMPTFGLLYDPALHGLNAEAIYDIIVNDLRKYRRLATFRGNGVGDMLEGGTADWWRLGDGLTLDEFYRRALQEGLNYQQQQGRGFLPASLIEEIMALSQPPIAWDVDLAHWFDAQFPPLEKHRSYARPSRRQASTPDIARPRYTWYPDDQAQRTFGVILDTSGSMDRQLLGKALGAIASYSVAREVGRVRVIFCDAAPYDQGYLSPEEIAGRVKVKGRGGTILMPAVQLLEKAEDFPPTAPLLVITDTYCDVVHVKPPRALAFLIPKGQRLPFSTYGDIFHLD